MNKLITLSILALIMFNSISLASAEISWSLPTTVQFTTGNDNGNNNGEDENNDNCNIFNDPQLIKDIEAENEFYDTKYGEWTCVNNKLQRTNIVQGIEEIEYGGLCGVSSEGQNSQTNYSILVLLVLIILIIITLILIILVFLRNSH
ncbi:hypothetical protein COU56_01910 [Candidatus Pacearchaeota archaeon CG10_big_fil_rev_8_21_14_0_10_31_9]|nr:MAG: hypothetical protein AUJ62_03765 [Candidatus Pacearchaeota archaeon CG1_02_32_21]PIN95355.1 MAG: hypothetical protein COU56_01910 [Candidatus Pacearchaeota archaeon CG10_big_fil_rev_8_21_14_0_10_31_9]PIZ83432.1 MAG: hypothetical protein COX97_01170 [Candidatus Pacearchaeota archaeon CG_4_10_14_0_2_um_filter_05_32_18]